MLSSTAKIARPFPSVEFAAKLTMELASLESTARFSMKSAGFMPCYAANCLAHSIVANCFVNFAVFTAIRSALAKQELAVPGRRGQSLARASRARRRDAPAFAQTLRRTSRATLRNTVRQDQVGRRACPA
jgi:hypothetical protein